MMSNILYLIPNTLGECDPSDVIPANIQNIINSINHYIVENERTVRRYLIKLGIKIPIDNISFYILNKHTTQTELESYLKIMQQNGRVGLISEAGVPGVADPGADLVSLAHRHSIKVVPLVGPSSILLALMASGMNGQNFAFHGYLPIEKSDRLRAIKEMEKNSKERKQAQVFMETPYRNHNLMDDILKTCHPDTEFCIASEITLENEFIQTKKIREWKNTLPRINKKPSIFLLYKR